MKPVTRFFLAALICYFVLTIFYLFGSFSDSNGSSRGPSRSAADRFTLPPVKLPNNDNIIENNFIENEKLGPKQQDNQWKNVQDEDGNVAKKNDDNDNEKNNNKIQNQNENQIQVFEPPFPHEQYKPRDIIDHRYPECQRIWTQSDYNKFGTISVVIIQHAEKHHHIELTVRSVLYQTRPGRLLKEIIIVDDFSPEPMPESITNLPKVKTIINQQREGLIRSRVFGADAATGDVIVFLDAHCECNEGWAEPLLNEIAKDYRTVAVPIIDILKEDETMAYTVTSGFRGGIRLPDFTFDWIPPIKDQPHHIPFKSPTHAGGLFAVSKKWWIEFGKYDMGMKVWGIENVEMSLRTWMCGGRVMIVPCSRIAHLFRRSFPYKLPGNPVGDNKVRMAKVWLDEYSSILLSRLPEKLVNEERPDLQERFELREKLQCKSFQWYIDNVYPELKEKLKEYTIPAKT